VGLIGGWCLYWASQVAFGGWVVRWGVLAWRLVMVAFEGLARFNESCVSGLGVWGGRGGVRRGSQGGGMSCECQTAGGSR